MAECADVSSGTVVKLIPASTTRGQLDESAFVPNARRTSS